MCSHRNKTTRCMADTHAAGCGHAKILPVPSLATSKPLVTTPVASPNARSLQKAAAVSGMVLLTNFQRRQGATVPTLQRRSVTPTPVPGPVPNNNLAAPGAMGLSARTSMRTGSLIARQRSTSPTTATINARLHTSQRPSRPEARPPYQPQRQPCSHNPLRRQTCQRPAPAHLRPCRSQQSPQL